MIGDKDTVHASDTCLELVLEERGANQILFKLRLSIRKQARLGRKLVKSHIVLPLE